MSVFIIKPYPLYSIGRLLRALRLHRPLLREPWSRVSAYIINTKALASFMIGRKPGGATAVRLFNQGLDGQELDVL
jgi:hypothetical protein